MFLHPTQVPKLRNPNQPKTNSVIVSARNGKYRHWPFGVYTAFLSVVHRESLQFSVMQSLHFCDLIEIKQLLSIKEDSFVDACMYQSEKGCSAQSANLDPSMRTYNWKQK
jgi:hypothetical protein